MIFRKKKIKELENTVASLVRTVETLQRRTDELEESFDELLEPVVKAFGDLDFESEKHKDDKNEEYSTVIDEWLNGGKK